MLVKGGPNVKLNPLSKSFEQHINNSWYFIKLMCIYKVLPQRYFQSIPHAVTVVALRWRHNDHAGVSNHQPPGCLLNRLFRRKSKKTSKLRVTGLCAGNSPGTGEFSAQMASYAENVSIWWRHHGMCKVLDHFTIWNVSNLFMYLYWI